MYEGSIALSVRGVTALLALLGTLRLLILLHHWQLHFLIAVEL